MTRIDFAILVLLLIGGAAGFAKFPDFMRMEEIHKITRKREVLLFFCAFDWVILFKIINRSFIRFGAAAFSALILLVAFVGLTFLPTALLLGLGAGTDWLSVSILDSSGVCFLLLSVQSWFKPVVDLRKLDETREEIFEIVNELRSSRGQTPDENVITRLRFYMNDFNIQVNSANNANVIEMDVRNRITDIQGLLKQINEYLAGPYAKIGENLRRMDLKQLQEGI